MRASIHDTDAGAGHHANIAGETRRRNSATIQNVGIALPLQITHARLFARNGHRLSPAIWSRLRNKESPGPALTEGNGDANNGLLYGVGGGGGITAQLLGRPPASFRHSTIRSWTAPVTTDFVICLSACLVRQLMRLMVSGDTHWFAPALPAARPGVHRRSWRAAGTGWSRF